MKVWSVAFICVAAINAVSSVAVTQNSQAEGYGGFYENSIDAGDIIEELFLDNCAELQDVKKTTIKTIITTADVTNSCSKAIYGVLNPIIGAVIIMGADKSANALACSKLNSNNDIFYNKYYDLPPSVKNLRDYIYSSVEMDVKVYTMSQIIIKDLRALVLDAKYDEAVEFTNHLYTTNSDAGKKIIISVVNQILQRNVGYQIMDFAFKLFQKDANIVDTCFPRVYLKIFNQHKVKILNYEKTGVLRLTTEIDSFEDRWLYSDCTNSDTTDEDVYWKFSPVWKDNLNGVVFLFENPFRGMRLKLDANKLGHFTDERLGWGDHRSNDPRFLWRLMPVGFNEHDELLFRLDDTVYNSCLAVSSCGLPKLDVKGSKLSCTPDMGWILETGELDLIKKQV